MGSPAHRRDIDGLRTFAILPVVLYHFGVRGFDGGFTGVDVFFVISGFLITQVIDRDLRAGAWSLSGFYERRARRLFPALYTMLACCVPAAALWLMPADYQRFSTAFTCAAAFVANIFFFRTTDYFDSPGDRQPLLHTWSLAVEEQFYLVFPLLMYAARRWLPSRALPWLLAMCAAASFYAARHYAKIEPTAVFYLPMFRAWELFMGAIVALGALPQIRMRVARDALGTLGLALIVWSAVKLSEDSGTPAPQPLLACIGTALVLYSGSAGETLAARFLSLPPLVYVGLVSYSLYLWHWPVWIFTRVSRFSPPTAAEQVALVGLSLLLAACSTRYVERPFRGPMGLGTRAQVLTASAVVIAVSVLVAPRVLAAVARPMPPDIAAIAAVGEEAQRYRKCDDSKTAQSKKCHMGVPKQKPTFMLWGDSHAMALGEALDELARRRHRSGLAFLRSACPPLLGVDCDRHEGGHCAAYNGQVVSLLRHTPSIDTVLLAARWAMYTDGVPTREGGTTRVKLTDTRKEVSGNQPVFAAGLARTLAELQRRGVRIVLFEQAPEPNFRVPSVLARAKFLGLSPPATPTLAQHRTRQHSVLGTLTALQSQYGVELLDLASVLCPKGVCLVEHEGVPMYRDRDHLSQAGARWALGSLPVFP